MSAKDRFHDIVKAALIQEGWTITHDPFYLDFDSARIQIDLAGERLMAAERDIDKIAVEVKSFLAASTIYEFHLAIGQCLSYRISLRSQEPEENFTLPFLFLPIKSFSVVLLLEKQFEKRKLI